MIIMIPNHLSDTIQCLGLEIRVLHLLFAEPSGVILFPHQKPQFIAKVKKYLIIRIMGCSYSICPHVFHKHQILLHSRKRERRAKLRVLFMPAKSFYSDGLPIKEKPAIPCLHLSESYSVNKIINRAVIIIDYYSYRVLSAITLSL